MSKLSTNDEGLTLIELIIYIVILGIISTAIVMILTNTLRAQASVTSQTQATTRGQLVSSEIEKAMRNAIAFTVSPDGSTLHVNTSFAGSKQCQAFALTSDGLKMSVSSSPAPDISVWPVWQKRVAAVGVSTPAFTALGGDGVTYAFNATSDSAPVRFTGNAYTRNDKTGVMGGC
ncbi:prepilin-type N-terminal cleavage/methylation domain-containing protein [Microbacterium sp. SS28]|uniref:prepilin-type N-terminal cleavage/methylation domain-containing protein n=1 Tax=Microbacterium sp. SS28 TaxID=2919948 RepID=UPI001FAA51C1|nr:prepilin-type N-terminal cleavage/methylation domain-containing protein [Microbacterium sp. SS28]